MPILTKGPDLAALQTYVRQLREERGFDKNPVGQDCLLLGEEVGELLEVADGATDKVAGELADVQIYLCTVANHFGVDLQTVPSLGVPPDLAALQGYVQKLREEQGSCANSVERDCILLSIALGKLFKAVRKAQGMPVDAASEIGTVAAKLGEVQISLCAIANHFGIDLENAFREKEEVNKRRVWQAS